MSAYIKLNSETDFSYPFHEGDIRLEYPEIPEELTGDNFPCPENFAKVQRGKIPSYDTQKQWLSSKVKKEGDVWIEEYEIVDFTQEQLDSFTTYKEILKQKEELINPKIPDAPELINPPKGKNFKIFEDGLSPEELDSLNKMLSKTA